MKDREIIIKYLVGTFLLTYLMWGAILVFNNYGYLTPGSIGFWVVYVIGGFSPTIFGALVSKKSGKVSSYKALLIETFKIKQKPHYYLLVLAFFTICFSIPFLFGILKSTMPWYFGILFIFQRIFLGGLEEIGWRYTLKPALERHMPFWLVSIITGSSWAIWHVPLFFIDGMNKGMNFGLFLLGGIAMSFMLGTIYRVSKSIWLCVLFHAMINAFSQVWVSNETVATTLISAGIKIALAVTIVLLYNYKLRKAKLS